MALPADFSKIYGSTATGGLTPISSVNYAKGWEFVGSNPPTKNDFSYLQNLSDLKSQWLYSNKLQRTNPFGDIASDGSAAIATALANLGLGGIALAGVSSGVLSDNGYVALPIIISGVKRTLLVQWGVAAESPITVTYPTAFPSRAVLAVATPLTSFAAGVSSVASANVDPISKTQLNIIVARTQGGSQVEFARSVAWLALGY